MARGVPGRIATKQTLPQLMRQAADIAETEGLWAGIDAMPEHQRSSALTWISAHVGSTVTYFVENSTIELQAKALRDAAAKVVQKGGKNPTKREDP